VENGNGHTSEVKMGRSVIYCCASARHSWQARTNTMRLQANRSILSFGIIEGHAREKLQRPRPQQAGNCSRVPQARDEKRRWRDWTSHISNIHYYVTLPCNPKNATKSSDRLDRLDHSPTGKHTRALLHIVARGTYKRSPTIWCAGCCKPLSAEKRRSRRHRKPRALGPGRHALARRHGRIRWLSLSQKAWQRPDRLKE
jgi:hypothetical protein